MPPAHRLHPTTAPVPPSSVRTTTVQRPTSSPACPLRLASTPPQGSRCARQRTPAGCAPCPATNEGGWQRRTRRGHTLCKQQQHEQLRVALQPKVHQPACSPRLCQRRTTNAADASRITLSSSGMSSCTNPPAELPHPAATALAVPTILQAGPGKSGAESGIAGTGSRHFCGRVCNTAGAGNRAVLQADHVHPVVQHVTIPGYQRRHRGQRPCRQPHRGLNMTEHQNWQATNEASEKPMKKRAAR